jgi:hypothetical protein
MSSLPQGFFAPATATSYPIAVSLMRTAMATKLQQYAELKEYLFETGQRDILLVSMYAPCSNSH